MAAYGLRERVLRVDFVHSPHSESKRLVCLVLYVQRGASIAPEFLIWCFQRCYLDNSEALTKDPPLAPKVQPKRRMLVKS